LPEEACRRPGWSGEDHVGGLESVAVDFNLNGIVGPGATDETCDWRVESDGAQGQMREERIDQRTETRAQSDEGTLGRCDRCGEHLKDRFDAVHSRKAAAVLFFKGEQLRK